jgi:hypothetical protein
MIIQTDTTPVKNLPSGFNIIANAATDVDTVVHENEVTVIDNVPEVRAVAVSSIDASVCSFHIGAKEMYDPFQETTNKMLTAKQRVQEDVSRQRKLVKTYNKSFENGLMKMPLLDSQNWFLPSIFQFSHASNGE